MSIQAKISALVKMAEQAETEGNVKEAADLTAIAHKMIEAAEKEKKEEKAARQMSGKAKAKFRAVKKACKALCDADLDYRGPHKKECRKVETLCEDILDALAEVEFE